MLEALLAVMAGQPAPATLIPSSEHPFIDRYAHRHSFDIRYFCNPYYFSDNFHISTDLTSLIPRFISVIQHAILIAVALGFNRIYLLRCDATNIVANVNTALGNSALGSYAYDVTSELDCWFQRQFSQRTMERRAESNLEVLVAFRWIAEYCSAHRIDLVNCSSRTVLDSVIRTRLIDVL